MQRMTYVMGLGAIKGAAPAAEAIPRAIVAMNVRLDPPTGLVAMSVEPARFDKIIEGALADCRHKTNPSIGSPKYYQRMLEAAMEI